MRPTSPEMRGKGQTCALDLSCPEEEEAVLERADVVVEKVWEMKKVWQYSCIISLLSSQSLAI